MERCRAAAHSATLFASGAPRAPPACPPAGRRPHLNTSRMHCAASSAVSHSLFVKARPRCRPVMRIWVGGGRGVGAGLGGLARPSGAAGPRQQPLSAAPVRLRLRSPCHRQHLPPPPPPSPGWRRWSHPARSTRPASRAARTWAGGSGWRGGGRRCRGGHARLPGARAPPSVAARRPAQRRQQGLPPPTGPAGGAHAGMVPSSMSRNGAMPTCGGRRQAGSGARGRAAQGGATRPKASLRGRRRRHEQGGGPRPPAGGSAGQGGRAGRHALRKRQSVGRRPENSCTLWQAPRRLACRGPEPCCNARRPPPPAPAARLRPSADRAARAAARAGCCPGPRPAAGVGGWGAGGQCSCVQSSGSSSSFSSSRLLPRSSSWQEGGWVGGWVGGWGAGEQCRWFATSVAARGLLPRSWQGVGEGRGGCWPAAQDADGSPPRGSLPHMQPRAIIPSGASSAVNLQAPPGRPQ